MKIKTQAEKRWTEKPQNEDKKREKLKEHRQSGVNSCIIKQSQKQ
jgi:hypothetical protein